MNFTYGKILGIIEKILWKLVDKYHRHQQVSLGLSKELRLEYSQASKDLGSY